jgi:hypothetical protein
MTKIVGESVNSFSFTVMLRESGASSNPRTIGFAHACPNRRAVVTGSPGQAGR